MPKTESSPQLSYALNGDPEHPRLLFANGLGGVKEAWFYQVRYFSPQHHVLTYDHRGAGASDGAGPEATMVDFVDDLLRLLDEIGWPDAAMVGISFGGRVLQQLALLAPERITRLVLVATSSGGRGHHPGDPAAQQALANAHLYDPEEWYTRVVPALFGPRYIAAQEKRLRIFARGRANKPVDMEGIAAQWAAYRGFDLSDHLWALRCPTLVVHGEDDALSPVENARFLSQNIPRAALRLLPGLGHSPQVEDPDAFNAALEPFLRAGG